MVWISSWTSKTVHAGGQGLTESRLAARQFCVALDGRFGIDDPAESKSRLRALKCLLRHFAQKQGQNGGPAHKPRGAI
jgi:hypothetical protein